MGKADLGTKRACLACGMRFYDFSRSPIICPGCGAEFDLENIIKSRKSRSVAKITTRKGVGTTDDNQIKDGDGADEMTDAIVDVNDDDDINFDDDDGVDVDNDGPGIIQDDITDDDELMPNLNNKDEN